MSHHPIEIAGVRVAPGSRARGTLEVRTPGTEPLALPVTLVAGAQPGPTLAVVAGLHGAEYCSIEAAIRLARAIDPAGLLGTLVVLPVANLPGFFARTAYVNPQDGKNLNRVFPGRLDGSPSEVIAHAIMSQVVARVDAVVDLHGGDLVEALVPFTLYARTGKAEVDTRSARIAHAYPVEHIVANELGASTAAGLLYAEAAARGVPAIIAEAGGQGVIREPDVQLHLDGLQGILAVLGMSQAPSPPRPAAREWARMVWLRAPGAGCLTLTVTVGESVTAGQVVGELRDLYGEPCAKLEAPATGPILFLVSSLAVSGGDPLLGVATG